jgi:hypothetical protein
MNFKDIKGIFNFGGSAYLTETFSFVKKLGYGI